MSFRAKSTVRMIAASFAAGAGAMALAGLAAPVIQAGLAIHDANAATVEPGGPLIAPLDVKAVQARLANADRELDAARARTDGVIARLERLSGR